MATGLVIRNNDGLVTLDMTSKISQMVGYVDTNQANGSIVIPLAPSGKTLFYAISELSVQDRYLGKRPGVGIALGTTSATLSWSYNYPGGWGFYSMNCRIHYGFH